MLQSIGRMLMMCQGVNAGRGLSANMVSGAAAATQAHQRPLRHKSFSAPSDLVKGQNAATISYSKGLALILLERRDRLRQAIAMASPKVVSPM
ncbi:hypothetical protein FKO01_07295 [Mesorhizobium sp. B2-3-3]|nr:hypothetical protein FKO01_07295 [Mesorhizobium sp. B2-3-3]